MIKNKSILLLALLTATVLSLRAQDRTEEVITQTANKVKMAQRDYRVVEKTIADILFKDDTVGDNRFYSYFFSSSQRYHLNVFASQEDVSSIGVAIYIYTDDHKWELVTRNGTTGTDVTLNFDPKESKLYYLIVTGTLRENIPSAFFNLVIERD